MAVYTRVDGATLERFMDGYQLGRVLRHEGIQSGVENTNYFVDTAEGRFVLTIYEKRVNPDELPFFIGLMEHLAERGIRCPLPIHGSDGFVIRQIAGKPATIATFLPGGAAEPITTGHCAALGAALAELHREGRSFTIRRPNALGPAGWVELLGRCAARADEVLPGLHAELDAALASIGASWPEGLPEGVIHADLFPDNIFFREEVVTGIIDFYFACNDLLAYDLAICLNAWCFKGEEFDFAPERAAALIEGYEAERPLLVAERAALPILCQGAALRFLLTRLYDWLHQVEGALVQPKRPHEYLAKLRHFRAHGLG